MTKLHRSESGKIVAGVCQGLGKYLGVNPLIVRIVFVLLALVNGMGLVLYLLAWLFIPAANTTYANQEEMLRQNAEEIGQRARELGNRARSTFAGKDVDDLDPWQEQDRPANSMLIAGVLLASIGLVILMRNLGLFSWVSITRLLPLALIAVGAVILFNNVRKA